MNQIRKSPLKKLGYDFIPHDHLPKGKDEYYLRLEQNQTGTPYRGLNTKEIELLKANGNSSDNWSKVLVTDPFLPELVQHCSFFGFVRIGKLEPYYLEFHNLRRPVGLYNSTIISSDLGNNVVIDNVNFLSHYIIGNDVIIINTSEIETTDYAKFGNGILKDGESENIRIKLEVCNENGGRSIIPFDGMLPGDAWLWSRFRDDELLQQKLKEFTDRQFDKRRGSYGTIGDRTVIKNCKIIKDVKIGSDAYLKGANKLKNLTINSSPMEKTQIGEGCELVNGIIGFGCRIFYGVKAVRFILASHSQLKYGARLINSYLGNNATISCCEVLNSLIFPAHEQHHNNSFLCAALLMGQSNMAAGATVGSNHNSRSADGELIAGRGFWPGLCVSLKHNSKFASFIILAKGDYPVELNIPLPFSLVSNDVAKDELMVMPAFWFLHDMYALARNAWKYTDRDKRTDKTQKLEFDFLAPDSINEMIAALELLEQFTGLAYLKLSEPDKSFSKEEVVAAGKKLFDEQDPVISVLDIFASHFENSKRKVRIVKAAQAYSVFKELIAYYAVTNMLSYRDSLLTAAQFRKSIPANLKTEAWINMGGQLIPSSAFNSLIRDVHEESIKSWDDIHRFYAIQGNSYAKDILHFSIAALHKVYNINLQTISDADLKVLLIKSIHTKEWLTKGIHDSRAKDYSNPFRKMVYENQKEMDVVIGNLNDNAFIKQEMAILQDFKNDVNGLISRWKL